MSRGFVRLSFLSLLVIAGLAAAAPQAIGRVAFAQIQKRLEVQVRGRFSAPLFQPVFYVRDASFDAWRGAGLAAGDLKVEYDVLMFLRSGLLDVTISGERLKVVLPPLLALQAGSRDNVLDRFEARLLLDTDGLREIKALEAESPAVHFRWGQNGREKPEGITR